MISRRRYFVLSVMALVCIAGASLADKQEDSERKLNFIISEIPHLWTEFWDGMGVIKPTHVAIMTLKKDIRFNKKHDGYFTEYVNTLNSI